MSKTLETANGVKSMFNKLFKSDIELYKDTLEASNIGAPVFTDEDLFDTRSTMDRLLRFFFIKMKITYSRFKNASVNHSKYMQLEDSSNINTEWTNLLKMAWGKKAKNGVTYRSLIYILGDILGFVVVDVKLTIKSVVTKEVTTVSLSEIEEYLRKESEDGKSGE